MKDKNGTTLNVGDKVKLHLSIGGLCSLPATGIVEDKSIPAYAAYECFVGGKDAGCFAYAEELEKL